MLKNINTNAAPTVEQIAMLKKAETMSFQFDDDCPELTADELAKFQRISADRNKERILNTH